MDNFEYVAVMVTVVLALGFSHILTSCGEMVANRQRIHGYWLYVLWAFLILLLHLQAWLVLWTRRVQEEFPVGQVVMMLAAASLIFIAARVLVPELSAQQRVDLRTHFFRVRAPLFGTLTAFWFFPIIGRLLFAGGTMTDPTMLARFALLGLSVLGLVVSRPRVHFAIAIIFSILLVGHLVFISQGVDA